MRKFLKKHLWMALLTLLMATIGTGMAHAETKTVSWSAVTTYTDGSPIAPATASYTIWWSTDASYTVKHFVAQGISGTSQVFDVVTEGMVRGTTVYFSGYATVNSTNSANATAYSWSVSYKVPEAPTNVHITMLDWLVPGLRQPDVDLQGAGRG